MTFPGRFCFSKKFKIFKNFFLKVLDILLIVCYNIIIGGEKKVEPKDWIGVVLTVWSNIIATIALIASIKDKRTKRKPQANPSEGKTSGNLGTAGRQRPAPSSFSIH